MAVSLTLRADATTYRPVSLLSSCSDTPWRSSSSSPPAGKSTLIPSIYVTFKLVQLVNRFRRQVNVQRSSNQTVSAKGAQEQLCDTLQRQAVEVVRECFQKPNRPPYRHLGVKHKPSRNTTATEDTSLHTHEDSFVHVNIRRSLENVSRLIVSGEQDLASVASNYDLFLVHQPRYSLKAVGHRDLGLLIVLIKNLLDSLPRLQAEFANPLPVCERDKVRQDFSDPIFVANLEHLLLRLQGEILLVFVAYFVESLRQHVLDCQREERRQCYEPVFQFPNAKHPLNTTWPWSIRPSLAILWGVCWMFYAQFDAEGNMVDTAGNIMVPSHIVQQYVSAMQRHGHQPLFQGTSNSNLAKDESEVVMRQRLVRDGVENDFAHGQMFQMPSPLAQFVQAQARQNSALGPTSQPHAAHLSTPSSPSQPHSESRWRAPVPRGRKSTTNSGIAGDQARHASLGLASPSTNNTYSSNNAALPTSSAAANAYSRPASAASAGSGWLPQDFQTGSLGFYSSLATDTTSWPLQSGNEQPAQLYDQSHILPQRSRNPTPSIRVTTEFADAAQPFSQPQNALHSASSVSSLPQNTFHPHHSYNSGHLSPHRPYNMPQEGENMQTPVSPVSGHNSPHEAVMLEQQISRKRSHSVMSQQDTQTHTQTLMTGQHHSRSGSLGSGAGASPNEHNEDGYSPRGSRAFKRGNPPVNELNKYICEWAEECQGIIFDRKCEWSKHMDKHDRPYRCQHLSCAKLQGFTYSGGLLRHEREVHGKHGGPKAQLMCPHVDCKRHSGKGFTRKENLNEHLRRVHPKDGVPQDSQYSQLSLLTRAGTDLTMGLEDGETSASRIAEAIENDEYADSPVLGKRRRTLDSTDGFDEKDEEIKRLRLELAREKQTRHQLEADTYRYQDDIRRLQESLLQGGLEQASQPPAKETAQV